MQRKQITISAEIYNAAQGLNDAQAAEYWYAVAVMAFEGKDITFNDETARAVFLAVRREIKTSFSKWANGCKGKNHGKKGGNPNFQKGRKNPYYDNPGDNPEKITPKITPKKAKVYTKYIDAGKDNPEHNPKEITPNITPKPPEIVNKSAASHARAKLEEDNLFINDNIYNNLKNNKENAEKKAQKRFLKPTPEQAQAYIDEFCTKKNHIARFTGEQFVASNDAKGWVVGKNKTPMKDWKGAIRTWILNEINDGQSDYNQSNTNDTRAAAAEAAAHIIARANADTNALPF